MNELEPQHTGIWAEQSPDRRVALVDLLDRVLAGGVVISGEVTLSVADVEMVHISLRTLITSVGALEQPRDGNGTAYP